jgi:putative tricarboxylic transport membrane protein
MTTRKEIAGNLAVILFGAVFLSYTARYPLDTWESPGPAVFPLILGALLTILGAGQLIRALWKSARKDHREKQRDGGRSMRESLLRKSGEGKALRMIAVFILYLLMMQWIGFFVSTFLFGTITSRLTETRGWGRPIALSTGITLFCYLLFEVWLKLSFPRGILF